MPGMGEIDYWGGIRDWFTTPPRRHGEILEDRVVSPLELFYDLVFVVFVSEIAHTLATHVSARGILDFGVLFGLVWVAWFNGTQFHELHGREDGRGRTFIFLQMGILAVVAVYAPHATSGDGVGFASAYAVLLAVQAYQWWSVLRIDEEQFRPLALRYLAAMCAGIGVIVLSALVADDDLRLGLWALVAVGALGLGLATIAAAGAGMVSLVEHAHDARTPTASSWLIAGAVAGLLVSLLTAMRALDDHERLAHVYRPLTPALLAATAAVLVLGALHPAPWLLALGLVAMLSATWCLAFLRFLQGT